MGFGLVLFAAVFASSSNLFMRRSVDAGGTTKAYLMIQLSIAALFATFLGPVRSGNYSVNTPIILLGLVAGFSLGIMMLALGRALEKGPPGLTIATLNGSTVMPGLVMASIFGKSFGYDYNLFHALGSLLVITGLLWAGWGTQGMKNRTSWLFLSAVAFITHILFLVLMQWRALMINSSLGGSVLSPIQPSDAISEWFMPMIYLAAASVQIYVFLTSETRKPLKAEVQAGAFGGIASCLSTFFLIWSTEVASPLENAMIFPLFSVGIILLCNGWGKVLYEEQVNWKACNLCLAGIFLGAVDWQSLVGTM